MFDFFPIGGKPDGLENSHGTAENQRTTQLTCGPGREMNRGHLDERRALYTQANHATHENIDCYEGHSMEILTAMRDTVKIIR